MSILVEASNGASDYGNKIGEPIIGGFTRSFSNYNNDSYEYNLKIPRNMHETKKFILKLKNNTLLGPLSLTTPSP